jgi:hypothetical protein
MISEQTKNIYIDTVSKLSVNKDFAEAFGKFLTSYDGNNEIEFHELMFKLFDLLNEQGTLKIMEEGYNKIKQASEDTQGEIGNVTHQFKMLQGKEKQSKVVYTG